MGLFEQMTPNEARLAVLAVGAVLIALVYLWGNRVRLRASLAERRRRRAQRAADLPELDAAVDEASDAAPAAGPGGYSDPFAHQRLVDVEIVPVRREPVAGAGASPAAAAASAVPAAPTLAPVAAPPPAAGAPAAAGPVPAIAPAPAAVVRPAPAARPVEPPAPKLDAEVGMSWGGPTARSESAPRGPEPGIPPLNLRPAANAARTESGAPLARGTPEVLIVVLTVMADPGARFTGMELLMAAHDLGLKFSKQGLFDGYVNGEVRGKPVFSIANVVEPGVFPPDDVQHLSTPGLLLFMRLPGSVEPLPALELLLSQSRRLAARLGGTLCDEQRRRLGPDGISELRVRVTDYQRRLRQMAPA